MAQTLHNSRLLLIVPVARVPTVVAWIRANIDPEAVPDNLGPELNSSGLHEDPATHNWCSSALIDDHCKQLLTEMCQQAGLTPPADWAGWTDEQKGSWLQTVQALLLASQGIWAAFSPNAGEWDDPQASLDAMGLKVRAGPPPLAAGAQSGSF